DNAKVAVHSDATIPPTRAAFLEAAKETCAEATTHTAVHATAPCAHALVRSFREALVRCLKCDNPKDTKEALDRVLAQTESECKDVRLSSGDWATALAVEDQVTALAKPKSIKGDFALVNRPY